MDVNKKPNFFVVGFPRSGTSSLHYYFSQHPDIFVTKEKELHYFANEVLGNLFRDNATKRKRSQISKEEFYTHYKDVSRERVIVDFGPYIVLSDKAAQRIFDFNNKAKILIIVRNPISFLHSLHAQFKRLGFVNKECLLKAYEDSKYSEIKFLNFYKWSDYTEKIDRFIKVFPRENVKIVFFKDFKSDTKKVYKEILEFAEVKDNVVTDFKVVNKARKQRFPNFVKVVEKIMKNHDVSNVFDLKIMQFLSSLFFKISLKERERKKLSSTTLKRIKNHTKQEVIKFNEFLHRYDFVEKNFDLLNYWDY